MSIERKKRGFLVDMHYFRAFAIVNIMLVHILHPPHAFHIPEDSTLLLKLSGVLFHDSTIYFIFISGFLFQYLSYKFEIRTYYKSKILNVISPYLVNSTLIMLVMSYGWGYYEMNYYTFIRNIILGETQTQYWYIPFITVIFAISPFLLKIKEKHFTIIALLLLFIPLFGTRNGIKITLGMYAYLFPVYCFGMVCAIHYEKLLLFCNKFNKILVLTSLALTALLYHSKVMHYDNFLIFNTEAIYYLQKMAILFVAIHTLQTIKTRNIKVLHLLANYSFSAYFLHLFVYKLLANTALEYFPRATTINWSMAAVPVAVICIALTISLAVLIKKITGRYSRMLIGA
jgi:peptidoglycan/LPS O-acetylase OafA/YrhL